MSVARAKKDLNDFVELRGSIAHRGRSTKSITKKQVFAYIDLVAVLAGKTDKAVNQYVLKATGTPLVQS